MLVIPTPVSSACFDWIELSLCYKIQKQLVKMENSTRVLTLHQKRQSLSRIIHNSHTTAPLAKEKGKSFNPAKKSDKLKECVLALWCVHIFCVRSCSLSWIAFLESQFELESSEKQSEEIYWSQNEIPNEKAGI